MTERSLTERAHDRLHRLPGMPEHSDVTHWPNRPLRNRPLQNRPLKNPRTNHSHKEPKILITWQAAIAGFFSPRRK